MHRMKAETFKLVVSIHLMPRGTYSECVRAAGEGRADFLDGFSNVISTTPQSLIVPPRHTSAGTGLRWVMLPDLISHCMIGLCTCTEPTAVTGCIRGDVKIHWQSLLTFAKVCWQLSIT